MSLDLKKIAARNPHHREVLRLAQIGLPIQLQGLTADGQDLAASVTAELCAMAQNCGDPALIARVGNLMKARADGSEAAARELCGLRISSSNNYLPAMYRWAAAMFRIENLAPGELPAWVYESLEQETPVHVTAIDGDTVNRRVVKKKEPVHLTMDMLWTERMEYSIRDWTNSAVVQSAQKTLRLSEAMARKIDALTFAQCAKNVSQGGLFGTFTTTGTKPSRVYVTDSAVNEDNLPSSNDITIDASTLTAFKLTGTANTTSTHFRDDVFRLILAYEAAWGGLLGAGPLFTGEILIPSIDVISIANGLNIGDAAGSDVTEQMTANGYARVRFLGRDFTLIGDPTLAPNVCYPVPVNKPGVIYSRPDMDDEDVETHKRKGIEHRALGKAFGCIIPIHQRIHALRIRYRTDA